MKRELRQRTEKHQADAQSLETQRLAVATSKTRVAEAEDAVASKKRECMKLNKQIDEVQAELSRTQVRLDLTVTEWGWIFGRFWPFFPPPSSPPYSAFFFSFLLTAHAQTHTHADPFPLLRSPYCEKQPRSETTLSSWPTGTRVESLSLSVPWNWQRPPQLPRAKGKRQSGVGSGNVRQRRSQRCRRSCWPCKSSTGLPTWPA